MRHSLAGLLLAAGLVAAVPTSSTSSFPPFTCSNNAFIVQGQALYSMDPATGTTTLIETGFGLGSSTNVNGLGYNVQDNYLYAITDSSVAIRISSANQWGQVAALPPASYSAGDVDNNNQFWLFAGITTYTQIDTTLNAVISTGTATPPTYVSDWVFLSGGGQALWSVNIANGVVVVFRFDMASKTFTTTATYGLLTGNIATNFNAIFAVGPTVFEAIDGTTNQIWRFDVTGATTPVKLAASFNGLDTGRDGARCLNAGAVPAPMSSTTTSSASTSSNTARAATTSTTTSAGPSVTARADGCYTDSYPIGRTLNDFPSTSSPSMTPYVCQQYCAQFGAALFGVEYYSECYCGNSLKSGAVPAPASDCNFACSGDASQTCGGNNRLNIYGVLPAVSSSSSTSASTSTTTATSSSTATSAGPSVTAQPDGCYTDPYLTTSRTLGDFPRLVSSSMTPLVCQQYCAQYSAALFGVEWGTECYCGNSIEGEAVPAPASDCNFGCAGDATKTCGGSARINIYGRIPAASTTSTTSAVTTTTTTTTSSSTTTSGGPTVTARADGCYTDNYPISRTLDQFPRLVSSSMTPLVCQQYCAQYNAVLFGVEYGSECYCGNTLGNGAIPAPAGDCSYGCAGDATQICGGNNRLNIYGIIPAVVGTTSSSTTRTFVASTPTTAPTTTTGSTTAVTTTSIPSTTTTTTTTTSRTTTSSAPATSSSAPAFAPFSCPSTAFVSEGQVLYSLDPATSTFTQIESGFGLPSTSTVNALGYNVQDNFLYAVTADNNVVLRISSNNKYQVVAAIAPSSYGWAAGDVDNNNQYWLFSGTSQWMQIDTRLNAVIASGTVVAPTYVNDWVYLSGGGRALWSVNVANEAVVLLRFDMNTKTFGTAATYSLLTGTDTTNFNAMFAISPTVFEALDSSTLQVWRFDITGATAPVAQQPFVRSSNNARDGARCIANLH